MQREQAINVANEIISMFEQHGGNEYAGEQVTQLQHMLQAGDLAREAGCDNEVILAAFLHDIGHICEAANEHNHMDGFGIMDHEEVGANYLKSIGFSPRLRELVEAHVDAKRYLTFSDSAYYQGLSDASKATLEFQGGPMKEEEASAFAQRPLFPLIIQLRKWDEAAKEVDKPMSELDYYRELIIQHLTN
jgi:phosphonate degradation associated HDIG domain protein